MKAANIILIMAAASGLMLPAPRAWSGGGNTCGSAAVIGALPFSDTGSTCGFGNSYDEACPSVSGAGDVVYRYTAPADGCVDVNLCLNTEYDSKLYVYAEPAGCPAVGGGISGLHLACDDDGCAAPATTASRIEDLPLVAGRTYWFVVDGSGDDCGDYRIRIAACGVLCQTSADCDDANPCTVDACIVGQCADTNAAPGTECDDDDVCTQDDACLAGVCAGTPVPGCADCNMNGVPDDEDIASGTTPDCNLNAVPDGCDIAAVTSEDANMNGVPDECSFWTPPAKTDELWGTAGNWSPPEVPDNTPARTFSVTIAGAARTVTLNIAAEIDTLRLVGGAMLNLTEPNLGIPPDLEVLAPGGALIRGDIRAARARRLTVSPGPLRMASGGVYRRHPGAPGIVSAELLAEQLVILEGAPGGAVLLEDDMSLEVFGDLIMSGMPGAPLSATGMDRSSGETARRANRIDGPRNPGVRRFAPPAGLLPADAARQAVPREVVEPGLSVGTWASPGSARLHAPVVEPARAGGPQPAAALVCTPPILRIEENAQATIRGDFTLIEAAVVQVDPTGNVSLEGDFDNQSTAPDLFDWPGTLALTGTGAQEFEVAGADVGPQGAGFDQNFALGTVEIAGTAEVSFRDAFDNDLAGQGSCTEAAYIDTLILRPGAAVTVDGCRLYYGTLIDEGATITLTGDPCAALIAITGDCDLDGDIDLNDHAELYDCYTGPAAGTLKPACQCTDLNADQRIDLHDWRALQSGYTAPR